MKRLPIITLLLLLLMSAIGSVSAQETGPLVAELSAPSGTFQVGDPIKLTLTVTHPAGYHVIMPQLEETWGDFSLWGQSAPRTVANDDGTETTSQVLDVQLFAPGTFSTPALPVKVTDGEGNLANVLVAPKPVTIDSVLAAGDTNLRDIKPQASLPLPSGWPWVAAGLAVAALVGTWLFWRRHKRTPAVYNRPPHEVALEALARIEQIDLPGKEQFKEHYALVSDIVRVYVERVFNLPILERTTAEIRPSLAASSVPTQIADQLMAFLEASDLVKFSTFEPDVASAHALVAQARAIVLSAEASLTSDHDPLRTDSVPVSGQTSKQDNTPPESQTGGGGQYRHVEVPT
jgi:hypothetical protein